MLSTNKEINLLTSFSIFDLNAVELRTGHDETHARMIQILTDGIIGTRTWSAFVGVTLRCVGSDDGQASESWRTWLVLARTTGDQFTVDSSKEDDHENDSEFHVVSSYVSEE